MWRGSANPDCNLPSRVRPSEEIQETKTESSRRSRGRADQLGPESSSHLFNSPSPRLAGHWRIDTHLSRP